MATRTTKKLVYVDTRIVVKQSDKHTLTELGPVTVENIRSPRKKSGSGRVTLKTSDGRMLEFPPSIINATWQ